jgi:hypothetical protein
LNEAVAAARSQAGLEPDSRVEILILPRAPGLAQRFLSRESQPAGLLPQPGEDLVRWLRRLAPMGEEEILSFEPALDPGGAGSALWP